MRAIALITSALLMTACSPADKAPMEAPVAQAAAPVAETAASVKRYAVLDFSADMASFVDVENGMPKSEAQRKIHKAFLASPEIGTHVEVEDEVLSAGISRAVITQSGLKDDSVSAQQFIAMYKTAPDGTQTLFNYGLRVKCARGPNSQTGIDIWQNTLCP